MKIHELGDRQNPHILFIHGGGNSWWNYLRQAQVLSTHYHVILPNLDGHGEEYTIPYASTEESANKLLDYIDRYCDGHLFALCGVSLGGQIVMELLSRRHDIATKAIIDGSLCIPNPSLARYCIATIKLFGGLILSDKACRFQIKTMPKTLPKNMLFPKEIQDYYLHDMPLTPKSTLISIYETYMINYALKESVKNTQAHVMYIYGSKEMKCVKQSAQLFQSYVHDCEIYEAKGYNHGYLSIYLPDEWLKIAEEFFKKA